MPDSKETFANALISLSEFWGMALEAAHGMRERAIEMGCDLSVADQVLVETYKSGLYNIDAELDTGRTERRRQNPLTEALADRLRQG